MTFWRHKRDDERNGFLIENGDTRMTGIADEQEFSENEEIDLISESSASDESEDSEREDPISVYEKKRDDAARMMEELEAQAPAVWNDDDFDTSSNNTTSTVSDSNDDYETVDEDELQPEITDKKLKRWLD